MIRVITIGKEYGSGGGPIAGIIARRLGWKLVDDSLVCEIARARRPTRAVLERYGESVDPWTHRILKALWRGGYEGAASRVEDEAFDADAIARLWHEVIQQAAGIGRCVTVGHGGQCLLQHRPDAFHVYVYAPLEERIQRIRDREPLGTDLAAAARERDRKRAAYIKHYFGQDWTNPHLYHLMVCAGIGLEKAASAILCGAGLAEESA